MPQPRLEAAVSLLNDPNPEIRELMVLEFLSNGSLGESYLNTFRNSAQPLVTATLVEMDRRAHERGPASSLRSACKRIETLAELESFCWHLSRWPRLAREDPEDRAWLTRWSDTVRERAAHLPVSEQGKVLVSVLAREEGFTGNSGNYHDPENTYFNSVIRRRTGLPITLTAVYQFVGERAGIRVEACALPGHVIARIGGNYYDPFHGGTALDASEWKDALQLADLPRAAFETSPLSPLEMAMRMTRNLIASHEKIGHFSGALACKVILTWLNNASRSQLRDGISSVS